MPWITLTTDDVLEEFNERERAALNAIKGNDSLTGIVSRVVARVRGAVLAGGTELGDVGRIPDSLAGDAVAIARWKFLISIPRSETLQTKERKDAATEAEDRLKKVESGDLRIESPSGSQSSAIPGPSFGETNRKFSLEDEEGA